MANIQFHHIDFSRFGFERWRRRERGRGRIEQRDHLRRFQRLMPNERWTIRAHDWTEETRRLNKIFVNESNRKNVAKKTFFGCSYSYWWINSKQRNIRAKAHASSSWSIVNYGRGVWKGHRKRSIDGEKIRIFFREKNNWTEGETIDGAGQNHEKWRRGNVNAFQIDGNRSLIIIIVSRSMCRESLVISLVMWVVLSEMRFLLTTDAVYHPRRKKKQFLLSFFFRVRWIRRCLLLLFFSSQGKKRGQGERFQLTSQLLLWRKKVEQWHLFPPPARFPAFFCSVRSMSSEGVDVWPSSSRVVCSRCQRRRKKNHDDIFIHSLTSILLFFFSFLFFAMRKLTRRSVHSAMT